PANATRAARRSLLEQLADEWLVRGSVTPALSWERFDPRAQLRVNDLFGVIAAQLLLAISSDRGVAICASPECGRAFALDRLPIIGQRTFCPTCGVRAAWREAKRDQRRADKAKGAAR